MNVVIDASYGRPVACQRTEIVERKGIGHPDTICDAIHERISIALCRAYRERFGHILHHNIDKGLLVAGTAEPRIGGGRIIEPMRLVIGDRATTEFNGQAIDVAAIVDAAVNQWVGDHLRFVDPSRHLVVQNELRPGSAQLDDIFHRAVIGANDTSAAVGYAPLTETEQMVMAAETFLNSSEFKRRFPETGEDVKVMGCRQDGVLTITVAVAFVDGHVPDPKTYFAQKAQIRQELVTHLTGRLKELYSVQCEINALDDPTRGEAGMYLTVLGTSAEGADCGQVGRGNGVNGLISLNRPSGSEAAAGKNPVSHVGKVYSLLTHVTAQEIHARVGGLQEVTVWFCSRIGRPLDQPLLASAQLLPEAGIELADVAPGAAEIIERRLAGIEAFSAELAEGKFPVC
ncbi:MAG: methionine adenosyltransferase [Desulfobacterales bacterium]|nr:methionine adenosyltransferase [Desulfobacterales bacterium]